MVKILVTHTCVNFIHYLGMVTVIVTHTELWFTIIRAMGKMDINYFMY